MEEEDRVVEAVVGRSDGCHVFHRRDGFYYLLREVRTRRARLRCHRYKSGCPATAVIRLNTMELFHLQRHLHGPDYLLLEDRRSRRELVAEAANENQGRNAKKILNDWKLRTLNPHLAMRFTPARMRSALYTAQASRYPKIPGSLLYLGILLGLPNMRGLCRTADGADTIFQGIAGCEAEKTTSVVSGRMLQFLQTISSLHMDGTFKKRPRKPKCRQIYNFTTKYGYNVVCVLRALMLSKSAASYHALYQYVLGLAPNIQLDRIHCDFDRGQLNALRLTIGPNCRICLWHYAAAFSSYARDLGLSELARENDVIYSFIRCLSVVPLLPAHRIVEGVLDIWNEVFASGWAETLQPLFEYLERQWFPLVNELSVYDQPERTNNCSECDNHAMGTAIATNRPRIWELVCGFVRLEYLAWLDKLAIDDNRIVTNSRRWTTIWNDERIQQSAAMLRDGDLNAGGFLHRVSWCMVAAVDHGLRLGDPDSDSDSDSD